MRRILQGNIFAPAVIFSRRNASDNRDTPSSFKSIDVDASMLSHSYWDTGLDEGGSFSPYDLDGLPDESSALSEFLPDHEADLLRQELVK